MKQRAAQGSGPIEGEASVLWLTTPVLWVILAGNESVSKANARSPRRGLCPYVWPPNYDSNRSHSD
jgi:hypothetical protein